MPTTPSAPGLREQHDPFTGERARHLFDAIDNRGIPGTFSYWQGTDDHVFLAPVPDNLGDHYAGGYQRIPDTEAELAAMARVDAYRLNEIKALVPSGRFLEIGPWIGLVSYTALKAGYDVTVIEMDQRCVDLLSSVGIHAVQSADPAKTMQSMPEKFDVVGLWHSIEHVPRPWDVIERAARLVAPGGVLLIAAPNPQSAQLRVLGKDWLHLDAPRHLHLMAIGTYEEIGRRAGLETVSKTTDDELGRILDRHGWTFELYRRSRNLPGVRRVVSRLFRAALARRHRQQGALDGAGFTLVMRRPPVASS